MENEGENKAIEILQDRIEELEQKERNLKYELEELKEYDFEELLRKARCFDKLKRQVTTFRNRLLEFEDQVNETANETENISIINLIKEVISKREDKGSVKDKNGTD